MSNEAVAAEWVRLAGFWLSEMAEAADAKREVVDAHLSIRGQARATMAIDASIAEMATHAQYAQRRFEQTFDRMLRLRKPLEVWSA